jgi:YVTN family beta-propeller protein
MIRKNIVLLTALSVFTLISCKKEESNFSFDGTYIESGAAIVVNEGSFGSNNGSASFISRNGQVSNNIFEAANGGDVLGDVFQSYSRVGNTGICVVNNSQKIVLVDARTFKYLATISDATKITYPRYAVAKDTSRLYVSNGSGTGTVLAIDLKTKTIAKTIAVGSGPEQMAILGNQLFVANSGGFGVDSTISVISLTTETVTNTVKVGDMPTKIVKDAQNNLWILCYGATDYSNWPDITKLTPTKLVKLNTSTLSVEKSFTLVPANSPSYNANLCIGDAGQTLYYSVGDEVFAMSIAATTLPEEPLISGREFYGLNANPFNGELVATYAPSFTQSGYVLRYSSTGTLRDSLRVGIGPNAVIFN